MDTKAEFMYVPKDQVFTKAKELNAIPYDIPEAEYSYYSEGCTFDFIIKKHQIAAPAVWELARIVRGADTDRFDLTPQAAGLWAISAGLSYNIPYDYDMLKVGIKVYDALYSWAKFVQEEKHTRSTV